ncbi:hypothetical protein HDU67_008635 [Dinochytrium kinnereticum]|nr:hypothetical protein HDU67_008635 [Dinochytrium kinnereticum]
MHLPSSSGKRKKRRLKLDWEEFLAAWGLWVSTLSLAFAKDSVGASEECRVDVRRLAVATGAPDWEDLTIDEGRTLFLQGEKHLLGLGVSKSPDLAFKRYLASSKCGLPDSMNMLGHLYENGAGCTKDIGSAIYWYKQAASHGFAESMNNLGRILESGLGVPVDVVQAGEWYLRAAERGNLDGMANIGRPPNSELAINWYRMAATQNLSKAQNALGSCYYRGKGVDQDHGEAVRWFKRAVEQGNPHAQNNLGICYEEGLGVVKDLLVAKSLYKAASEAHHPSGTNNYGFMLMLEERWWDAFRVFLIAWGLGSADAAYNLGVMYEMGCSDSTGIVIKQDIDTAIRWYREGAAKNQQS